MKKVAYVAPIVLSLAATPAFARNGSNGGSNGGGCQCTPETPECCV